MARARTFSNMHLQAQQVAHARSDGYGRHRHLYLHDTMRRLAAEVAAARGHDDSRGVSLLDYGCGKGTFMAEMRGLDVFAEIAGYDPAVRGFQARPLKTFDIVTCLDVLDIVESRYVDAILEDVADLTAAIAVFDCLCRPKTNLPPHPPFYWNQLVARRFRVQRMSVEFQGMQDFERAVIYAVPLAEAGSSRRNSPSQGS